MCVLRPRLIGTLAPVSPFCRQMKDVWVQKTVETKDALKGVRRPLPAFFSQRAVSIADIAKK